MLLRPPSLQASPGRARSPDGLSKSLTPVVAAGGSVDVGRSGPATAGPAVTALSVQESAGRAFGMSRLILRTSGSMAPALRLALCGYLHSDWDGGADCRAKYVRWVEEARRSQCRYSCRADAGESGTDPPRADSRCSSSTGSDGQCPAPPRLSPVRRVAMPHLVKCGCAPPLPLRPGSAA